MWNFGYRVRRFLQIRSRKSMISPPSQTQWLTLKLSKSLTVLKVLLPLTLSHSNSVLLPLTHCAKGTLSLSFSNFRFWNFMMLPISIFNFRSFWVLVIHVISMNACILFCLVVWKMSKLKKNDFFFLTNWAFELLDSVKSVNI